MGKKSKKGDQLSYKKAEQKHLDRLARTGEDSIEKILEEFNAEKESKITINKGIRPSPRSHYSITAISDTDEILIFGGEFFDGKKTHMYSTLYSYSKNGEWNEIISKPCPAPRSSHQAIYIANEKTVYLFGGEYVSKDQNQFKHFNDLWALNVKNRTWTQIQVKGGPCGRSGHRLAPWKNGFLLFGGFSDIGIKPLYFNDLWYFDLGSKVWNKLQLPPSPVIPPRSSFIFTTSCDNKTVFIYGGFSRSENKGPGKGQSEEKAIVHKDLVQISFNNNTILVAINNVSGAKPNPPRTGLSFVKPSAKNLLYVFGGVHDIEEDDDLVSTYSNELLTLNLDKSKWYPFSYASPEAEPMDVDGEAGSQVLPLARSHAGLVHLDNKLYMFGGISEKSEKEISFNDLHVLDLKNPSGWSCLEKGNTENISSLDDDSSDDSSDEIEAPVPLTNESLNDYFARNRDFWIQVVEEDDDEVENGNVEKSAKSLAKAFLKEYNS